MKAVFYKKYGPPSLIEVKEADKPIPKEKELLVKVHAATVNRTDTGIRTANYFVSRFFTGLLKPKQPISGTDFSGEIQAIGNSVTNFKGGDKVFGFNDVGIQSHAEYMTIHEKEAIALIPNNINYTQAAASMEGAHYAINFLNKVKLQKGDKVMVYGATGAIGSAMVQLLKAKGIYVTAVCGTAHTEKVKALGADKVIDYQTSDFTADTEKYHCVFDAVGKSTFGNCKKLLLPKGIYISSELGPYAQNIFYSLFTPIFGGKKVKFPLPLDIKKSMSILQPMLVHGSFKPLIDKTYSIEQTEEAFTYALAGKKVGNIVIEF